MHREANISSFDQIVGAIRLDRNAYRRIEELPSLLPATAIVVLVGIANGISLAAATGEGAVIFVTALIGNLAAWVVFGGIAYVLGTAIMPDEASIAEATPKGVLNSVGFAMAPNVLGIAGALGIAGQLLSLPAMLWMFACAIVALSVSLRVSTGRAVAFWIISGFLTLIPISVLVSLLQAFS